MGLPELDGGVIPRRRGEAKLRWGISKTPSLIHTPFTHPRKPIANCQKWSCLWHEDSDSRILGQVPIIQENNNNNKILNHIHTKKVKKIIKTK